MIDAILLALTATVAGGPDTAAPPPPPPAPASTANAEKRYCVVETIVGSHIPMRKCRTRAEWLDRGFDPLDPT